MASRQLLVLIRISPAGQHRFPHYRQIRIPLVTLQCLPFESIEVVLIPLTPRGTSRTTVPIELAALRCMVTLFVSIGHPTVAAQSVIVLPMQ